MDKTYFDNDKNLIASIYDDIYQWLSNVILDEYEFTTLSNFVKELKPLDDGRVYAITSIMKMTNSSITITNPVYHIIENVNIEDIATSIRTQNIKSSVLFSLRDIDKDEIFENILLFITTGRNRRIIRVRYASTEIDKNLLFVAKDGDLLDSNIFYDEKEVEVLNDAVYKLMSFIRTRYEDLLKELEGIINDSYIMRSASKIINIGDMSFSNSSGSLLMDYIENLLMGDNDDDQNC